MSTGFRRDGGAPSQGYPARQSTTKQAMDMCAPPDSRRTAQAAAGARIIEHRALTGAGAVTDTFDIELPSGMRVHDCKVISKDGRRWAMPPSKVRVWGGEVKTGLDGKPLYDPVVTFASREKADAFSALALAALDEYLGGGR